MSVDVTVYVCDLPSAEGLSQLQSDLAHCSEFHICLISERDPKSQCLKHVRMLPVLRVYLG